jgi:hypothetical protein
LNSGFGNILTRNHRYLVTSDLQFSFLAKGLKYSLLKSIWHILKMLFLYLDVHLICQRYFRGAKFTKPHQLELWFHKITIRGNLPQLWVSSSIEPKSHSLVIETFSHYPCPQVSWHMHGRGGGSLRSSRERTWTGSLLETNQKCIWFFVIIDQNLFKNKLVGLDCPKSLPSHVVANLRAWLS